LIIDMIRISSAVMLIVVAGLVHGAWTNRWGQTRAVAALVKRVESVPMIIGDWKATGFELNDGEPAAVGASAFLARVYTNPGRAVSVSVLIVGGLPGDICKHTPEVCYPGAGYALQSLSPYAYRYGDDVPRQARFRSAVAIRQGTKPSILRIFWGWNASHGWDVPEQPRWVYGSEPTLCKLYIIRETAGAIVDPGVDPCNDFLSVFLPELDRLVFSTPN
jgi:hypothetical protein